MKPEALDRKSAEPLVGVGYRAPLGEWIASRPAEISCLEITAEHFFDGGESRLRELSRDYPLYVHGLGLSLGTPGPLDEETLARFARVVDVADPAWISEHVAFTRSNEVDLGHLNPLQPCEETLAILVAHAREVSDRCGKPLVLENITSHLRIEGEFSETDFLNRLCEKADCGLLLDVTNLFINSKNHGFDPRDWLRNLDPDRIVQLHVIGYTVRNGRWEDCHSEPIQEDLLDLLREVLEYARVSSIIVERDDNFPPIEDLARELRELQDIVRARRTCT